MQILFIGDIVGKSGRRVLTDNIEKLKSKHNPDLVIVNCENSASGFGVTPTIADQLFALGCDVLTSGNHIWDRKEIIPYIDLQPRLLRPYNYPPDTPGAGYYIVKCKSGCNVAVVNLMGQIFMSTILTCPFRGMDALIQQIQDQVDVIFLDFHGEASSEKQALAHYLDGRVSAIVGTHTHVPTADERILAKGTAYITDVGMTGDYQSVIGMKAQFSVKRFLGKLPQRLEVADGAATLQGVSISIDESTGLSTSIERISCQ